MGFKEHLCHYWKIRTEKYAHLLNLVRSEAVLEDLEVGDKLIFVLRVHLHTSHWNIAYMYSKHTVAVTQPPFVDEEKKDTDQRSSP